MKRILKKAIKKILCFGILAATAITSAAASQMPILMYHDITEDSNKTNSLTITEERFRLDMEFLKEFGYTALLPEDLVKIQKGQMKMPKKPIMVTFDDGYLSNYTYAYPILQQTDTKAAIAVVAHNMKTDEYLAEERSMLCWSEMREMSDSGLVEIGLHTYNLHNPQHAGAIAPDGINGVDRLKGETKENYNLRVGGDLSKGLSVIEQNLGKKVHLFAYPYGACDGWMEELLTQSNVAVSVLTNPGYSDIAKGLRKLPRYSINMNRTAALVLQEKSKAIPTVAAVDMNGTHCALAAYKIGGNNYVRVRDVADLIKDTASGFDVHWNSNTKRVGLVSFAAYSPLGTENRAVGKETKTVYSLKEPTVIDDAAHTVAAYNIGGNTFYKLRSLADCCGFHVDWDKKNHSVVITA